MQGGREKGIFTPLVTRNITTLQGYAHTYNMYIMRYAESTVTRCTRGA